eukprot:TRINITY_DN8444_c0_g1_i1.p1 TRINITY_DN8444_c0_g1~~TRINITY_DN8444_c0_g1_i1.p1  ORF type:complete len:513 (-),score=152.34 TRINITY_DN8444_c0_g1_i1:827-2176(-)
MLNSHVVDQRSVTLECQSLICKILEMILDIQLDSRLSDLLILLKNHMDQSQSHETDGKTPTLDLTADTIKKYLNSILVEDENRVLADLNSSEDQVVKIFFRLMMNEDYDLALSSANLLFRRFSATTELLCVLQHVQILVTKTSVNMYQIVSDKLEKLRKIIYSFSLDPFQKQQNEEAIIETLRLLNSLFTACPRHRSSTLSELSQKERVLSWNDEDVVEALIVEHQQIFLNTKSHLMALRLFQLYESGETEEGKAICELACIFLKKFCTTNDENQQAMFPYFEFFLKRMAFIPSAADLVMEMLRDNRYLCSQIKEEHIRDIIKCVGGDEKNSVFIDILETLIVPQGVPYRKNQISVLKLLIENQHHLVLFNTPDTIALRNEILQREGENHSLIIFHKKVVSLLAKCARGKVHETEVTTQSLYSLMDVFNQLSNPNTPRSIKGLFHLLHG